MHYWLYSHCGMLKNLLSLNYKEEAMHLWILSNGRETIKKSKAFMSKSDRNKNIPDFLVGL